MDEYIGTILLLDETVSFLIAEPLYNPFRQSATSFQRSVGCAAKAKVATLAKEMILQSKNDLPSPL